MESRLRALRSTLTRRRLDALLITTPENIRYLSGFTGSSAVLLVSQRRQMLITDGRYREQVREEVKGFRIVIAQGGMFEELQKRGWIARGRNVGIEAESLSVAQLRVLRRLLRGTPFKPTSNIVESLAAVKDTPEIERIRRAVATTDRVFLDLLSIIKPGIAELDVAAEISYLHRRYGAEADAFEPIVASGRRSAFPHARATSRKIGRGEPLLLDFGCRVDGYHSDMTRTIAVGRPSREFTSVYRLVWQAQARALDAVVDGAAGKAVDAVARSHIRSAGYGKYFTHSLGHGLGLRVHEAPRLSVLSKDRLETGNVVTVEPGIYVPGKFGIRIEDVVVVRPGGCDILTASPKELIIL